MISHVMVVFFNKLLIIGFIDKLMMFGSDEGCLST